MKWRKKGLIYAPDGTSAWAKHSAMTPTPIFLNEDIIRIYAGFRDELGVSRIGYVDVDANNPSKVIRISENPVLDVGIPGTFDDNGAILGDIIAFNNVLYMYYVGFQLVQKVKFLAFTGLAISKDGGNSFCRYSKSPVLDRSDNEIYFRAIHSAIIEYETWKIWYGVGSDWVFIDNQPYPKYNIKYLESKDGINFESDGELCIDLKGNEYRIGRPRIIKDDKLYRMFYTYGTLRKEYLSGYAESKDGKNWIRKDDEIGIDVSESGWDSQMLCYPSVIKHKDKVYMFYNGNNYGQTGFGYAVLEEW